MRFAVYSIINPASAHCALENHGTGSLKEGRRWKRAADELETSKPLEPIPLLLADAATTIGVQWVAKIVAIDLRKDGTTVQFSDLVPLARTIPLGRLLKASDGNQLADTYIRPYVPCLLTKSVDSHIKRAFQSPPQIKDEALLEKMGAEQAIAADPKCKGLSPTTRAALVEARIGQGGYRERMMKLWGRSCAVSGISLAVLLTASHAKPWAVCSNEERLDEHNGLLLSASLDRLFDSGLIAFSDDGTLLRKLQVTDALLSNMGIKPNARLRKVPKITMQYLAVHRVQHGFS